MAIAYREEAICSAPFQVQYLIISKFWVYINKIVKLNYPSFLVNASELKWDWIS